METNFTGKISANLTATKIDDLCTQHIPGYDNKRFKVMAVRIYAGDEFIVTVFAADTFHQPTFGDTSLVKKFKITTMQPADIFNYLGSYNFTLVEEKSSLEEMAVLNK